MPPQASPVRRWIARVIPRASDLAAHPPPGGAGPQPQRDHRTKGLTGRPWPNSNGLHLRWHCRPAPTSQGYAAGTVAVTLFLTNERKKAITLVERDQNSAFQAELELRCPQGFVARLDPHASRASGDWDEAVNALQFRDAREYGVGHNVGVEVDQGADGGCTRLRTTWIPQATRGEGGAPRRCGLRAGHGGARSPGEPGIRGHSRRPDAPGGALRGSGSASRPPWPGSTPSSRPPPSSCSPMPAARPSASPAASRPSPSPTSATPSRSPIAPWRLPPASAMA